MPHTQPGGGTQHSTRPVPGMTAAAMHRSAGDAQQDVWEKDCAVGSGYCYRVVETADGAAGEVPAGTVGLGLDGARPRLATGSGH